MRNYEKEKKETRSKILHAFWEIYRTTRIEKITVKQITEACGIYRTTFYLHYSDVYAILEGLEKELLDELRTFQSEISMETEGRKQTLEHFYRICKEQKKFLTVLILKQQSNFAVQYKQEMVDIFCKIYNIPNHCVENVLDKLMMSAFVEGFISWLNYEGVEFEEIYQTLENYLTKGILNSVLQK